MEKRRLLEVFNNFFKNKGFLLRVWRSRSLFPLILNSEYVIYSIFFYLLFSAAEQAGMIMIVSCWAMAKFEEIAASAPKAKLWMQIYPFGDRRNSLNMIRRAEHNGYKAIVITVDSPRIGIFKRSFRSGDELKQQFASLKPGWAETCCNTFIR